GSLTSAVASGSVSPLVRHTIRGRTLLARRGGQPRWRHRLMALCNSSGKQVHHSRLLFYHPRVEALEDRTLLSFITAPSYFAGTNPASVAVGDFDGDGTPDLAVVNCSIQGTVSILLGGGAGTFSTPIRYAVGSSPW